MSTILLTGMTASQASPSANSKSRQFAHSLYSALTSAGHTVNWTDPEITWQSQDLEQKYDAVLIGVAPLTSLAANRTYGALSLISTAFNSAKTCFFIDAPEPAQIIDSLESVARGKSNLFKPFYSYRKHYNEVLNSTHRARIDTAIHLLSSQRWPLTLYPKLPWEQKPLSLNAEQTGLPFGINLDAFAVMKNRPFVSERENVWAIDSYRTKWALSVAKGLVYPTTPMRQSKGSTDSDVNEIMDAALGSIISPQKSGGTWWTNRYPQALNALSPIATEWRESSHIGDAWNYLPAAIEGLSAKERLDLSHTQKEQYLAAVNTTDSALYELESLLGLKRTHG